MIVISQSVYLNPGTSNPAVTRYAASGREGEAGRIIEERAMSVRESVHQLVDALPEERLDDVLDYLADLNDTEELSPETRAAIEEGLADIRHGRTVTLEEYRRTRGL